ncbi:something about silencing protein 10 [Diabrotica virgifera virgifera]|uniref:Something about silencing protein 10 n=1 Tax=Diabrotica virgifera virgifera TaxID=50390 RepID=A0A6P7GRV5_DIAVI|nr:something about silencing protein 10 [Diabrotica virgifera virgifera]
MRIDNDEDYSASDSDDDYTENERILLNKVRNRGKKFSDDEQEVFGVGGDESEDNEDDDGDGSDLALSDVEGQEDDNLPDTRAWGKDKRKFYQTDYVDGDYGGFQGKDAQLAELEEEEARNLQKQLAQHLDDDDFGLDIFAKKADEDDKQNEEIIKTDISKLSKRQKLQIMQKESPEFFNLVQDFQNKMAVVTSHLHPVLKKAETGDIPQCKAVDFVQFKYELILNYCTNIYMYLLLKSSKVNVQNHPLIKRLYQYRQLLLKLEPVYEDVIKPQIELILNEETKEADTENPKKKKKTLKLLTSIAKKTAPEKVPKRKTSNEQAPEVVKKVKFDEGSLVKEKETMKQKEISSAEEEAEEELENIEGIEEDNEEEPSKRAITYEMAKNKGLTPHRKKEQRNPRVKHKLKYRKAVIRRKGAVREPRKELSRYGGEISGIKSTVSRSIKIKT